MLHLVGIGVVFTTMFKYGIAFQVHNTRRTGVFHINTSFGSLKILPHFGPSTWLMAALTGNHRTTWVGKFHKVMITYFTVVYAGSDLAPAHTLSGNRILSQEPVGNINIVNVLL